MNKYTVRIYRPYYNLLKEFANTSVLALDEVNAIREALKGRKVLNIKQYPDGRYGISMQRVEYTATVQMTICNVKE